MPKHLLYGPVIFGIVGTACGVGLAMLFRYDEYNDRVYLEESLPLAVGGILIGAIVGCAVAPLYLQCPRLRGWVELTATALLLGGVCAVLGWLGGDKRGGNPPSGMVWGLLVGLALGSCIGAVSLVVNRRRPSRPDNPCT